MQYSLSDLLGRAGEWPREKATRTDLRRLTLSLQQRRIMFLAHSHEVYSSPAGHIVSLFYPKAGRLERLLTKGSLTPTNQICRVGCSCEAWLYWGAAYKSTDEGYRLPGESWRESRAPGVRDPEGSYWICKHVIRVGQYLQDVSFASLVAQGDVLTPDHARYSLDAVRPAIGSLMQIAGGAPDAIATALDALLPDTAEALMEGLGMLCEAA